MSPLRTYPRGVTCWVDLESGDVQATFRRPARSMPSSSGGRSVRSLRRATRSLSSMARMRQASAHSHPLTSRSRGRRRGTPTSPSAISTGQRTRSRRLVAVSHSRPPSLGMAPAPRRASTPAVCPFVYGRRPGDRARRPSTHPAGGTSVISIQRIRQRQSPSTRAFSVGGSMRSDLRR